MRQRDLCLLPRPAPSAPENVFFDIVFVATDRLYVKYVSSLYVKYAKILGRNRHFWQLSPKRRYGYV